MQLKKLEKGSNKKKNKRTIRQNKKIKTEINKLNLKLKCLKCIVKNILPTIQYKI